MNNILQIIAYSLGGVALIVSSFVTFSVLTGTPMHKMKAVGAMFPDQMDAEVTEIDPSMLPDVEFELEGDVRTTSQVYENATSSLGAFALQDPFSADELSALEQKLQHKLAEVVRRTRELDDREQRLEEDRQHNEDLYKQLVDLRSTLLDEGAENDLAKDELSNGNRVLQERKLETYAQMATLFEGTKAPEAAGMLTKTYGPKEAAYVLLQLDDDRVRELMTAIYTALPDEGPLYFRALQDLRASRTT